MIRVLSIDNDSYIKKVNTIEELSETNNLWYWIDFHVPTKEETLKLRAPLNFHPLAIEDCLHNIQRPKLDYYDTYSFFVTHRLNETTAKKEEINIFINDQFIVTYHHFPSPEIEKVRRKLLESTHTPGITPFSILYQILDNIVDNYFPIIYKMEDELAEIDDNTDNKPMNLLLEDLFTIRHTLLSIRQTVMPMRDLLQKVVSSQKIAAIHEEVEYYSDIYDHLLKLTEMIEACRELTTDIRDSYLSYNSHHTNRIMQILTVITTIFMPLSFLAGLYGMNFVHMPELHYKYGYYILLIFMGIISVSMFLVFKKKGWFK